MRWKTLEFQFVIRGSLLTVTEQTQAWGITAVCQRRKGVVGFCVLPIFCASWEDGVSNAPPPVPKLLCSDCTKAFPI